VQGETQNLASTSQSSQRISSIEALLEARKAARIEARSQSASAVSRATSSVQTSSVSSHAAAKSSAASASMAHTVALPNTSAPFPTLPRAVTPDIPANAWYAIPAKEAVQNGLIAPRPNGDFDPTGSVTSDELATTLEHLGIDISTLDALPTNPTVILTRGRVLKILADAFDPTLQAILSTKTQDEYTRIWNAIPQSTPYYDAVRMTILAGWVSLPSEGFDASERINRAELAKILANMNLR
jgi:hypothetical protein